MALSAWHRLLSKQMWFVIFNVGSIGYMWISGRLHWTAIDIFSVVVALLIMNGICLYSTRLYPEWQWTYKQQRDWDQKGAQPVNQSSPDSKEQ